jgi:hypothetical protein
MKFVATKTADQLDLQALHRVRARLRRAHPSHIRQGASPASARGAR